MCVNKIKSYYICFSYICAGNKGGGGSLLFNWEKP